MQWNESQRHIMLFHLSQTNVEPSYSVNIDPVPVWTNSYSMTLLCKATDEVYSCPFWIADIFKQGM